MFARLIVFLTIFSSNIAFGSDQYTPVEQMLLTVPSSPLTTEEQRIQTAFREKLEPTLYNGRPIRPGELPISVYIGNCTATILGPNTIMTAAHCRSTGSTAAFTKDNVKYSGKCERHPDYNRGGSTNNDFALCDFEPAINLPFYSYLSKRTLAAEDRVVMQGYGAGSNGVLNVGDSVIFKVDNQDYTTDTTVQLGGGDSGGGLFAGPIADLTVGPFEWVGVNSRKQVGGRKSYFNISGLERSWTYFNAYAAKNSNRRICGVNWEIAECARVEGPNNQCAEEAEVVKYLKFQTSLAEKELAMCRARPN